MLQFLQNDKACRGAAILKYFGEASGSSCGHCDVCRAASANIPAGKDLRTFITDALHTAAGPVRLGELSSRLPEDARPVLIAALRGMVESEQITWHPDNSFSIPLSIKKIKAARK